MEIVKSIDMKHSKLVKLEKVLRKLEVIHVYALKRDDEKLKEFSMEAINILDEIVPQPLPDDE